MPLFILQPQGRQSGTPSSRWRNVTRSPSCSKNRMWRGASERCTTRCISTCWASSSCITSPWMCGATRWLVYSCYISSSSLGSSWITSTTRLPGRSYQGCCVDSWCTRLAPWHIVYSRSRSSRTTPRSWSTTPGLVCMVSAASSSISIIVASRSSTMPSIRGSSPWELSSRLSSACVAPLPRWSTSVRTHSVVRFGRWAP